MQEWKKLEEKADLFKRNKKKLVKGEFTNRAANAQKAVKKFDKDLSRRAQRVLAKTKSEPDAESLNSAFSNKSPAAREQRPKSSSRPSTAPTSSSTGDLVEISSPLSQTMPARCVEYVLHEAHVNRARMSCCSPGKRTPSPNARRQRKRPQNLKHTRPKTAEGGADGDETIPEAPAEDDDALESKTDRDLRIHRTNSIVTTPKSPKFLQLGHHDESKKGLADRALCRISSKLCIINDKIVPSKVFSGVVQAVWGCIVTVEDGSGEDEMTVSATTAEVKTRKSRVNLRLTLGLWL